MNIWSLSYDVIAPVPDDKIEEVVQLLSDARSCGKAPGEWDWEFADSEHVRFRFSDEKAALMCNAYCNFSGWRAENNFTE